MRSDGLLRPVEVGADLGADFVLAWARLDVDRAEGSNRHPKAILVVLGVDFAVGHLSQSGLEIFHWIEARWVEISHHLVCRHLRMLPLVIFRLCMGVVKIYRHDLLRYFVPELVCEDVLLSPFLVEGAHVVLLILTWSRTKRTLR